MTIAELKEVLSQIPDDFQVFFEYDGPDAFTIIVANHINVCVRERFMIIRHDDNIPSTINKPLTEN